MGWKYGPEEVLKDVEAFFRRFHEVHEEPSAFSQQLLACCGGNKDILLDAEALSRELLSRGSKPLQIASIMLITGVGSFRELLLQSKPTRADVGHFIEHALRETGLTRQRIMEALWDLAPVLEMENGYVPFVTDSWSGNGEENLLPDPFILPPYSYRLELLAFERPEVLEAMDRGELSPFQTEQLLYLYRSGVTKAKYLLGRAMLANMDLAGRAGRTAISLLEEAWREGSPEASYLLGDYYFEQDTPDRYERAFFYYSSLGGLALDEAGKSRMTDILNLERYNKKILKVSGILAAAMMVSILAVFLLSIGFFGLAAGGVTLLLLSGILAAACVFRSRVRFFDMSFLPPTLFLVWFLCAVILLI